MSQEACSTKHTRTYNINQSDVFYSCDCANRRNLSRVLFYYYTTRACDVIRILYANRSSSFANRQHATRMKNLSAEHSKLLSFFISNFRNRLSLFYYARVCCKNTVNILPGLNFFSTHSSTNHIFSNKSSYDRNMIVRAVFVIIEMRRNVFPNLIEKLCRHIV